MGILMKNFAGIQLDSLDTENLVDRYAVSKAFVLAYQNQYRYPTDHITPIDLTGYVENCIQANLSLPINSEDALSMAIEFIPADEYLTSDTRANLQIKMLKLCLKDYKIDNASDRLRAVNLISNTIKLHKDWRTTAADLCHAISYANLDIAEQQFEKINNMHGTGEYAQYVLGLKISYYMDIMTYLERRIDALHPPFYNMYQPLYVERLDLLYGKVNRCLLSSLLSLKSMPEYVQSQPRDLMSRRVLLLLSGTCRPRKVEPEDCFNGEKLRI